MRALSIVVALAAATSLFACKKESEEASAPAPAYEAAPQGTPGPASHLPTLQGFDPNRRVSKMKPTETGEPPPDLGDVKTFSGFSRDESHFAFVASGEGGPRLDVVNAAGEIVQHFDLVDPTSQRVAHNFLSEHRFSRNMGELPAAQKPLAAVRSGKVVVTTGTTGPDAKKPIYEGNPFAVKGGTAKPALASVAQVSPSGKRVAVKVESAKAGGTATTTYVLIDLAAPEGAAK